MKRRVLFTLAVMCLLPSFVLSQTSSSAAIGSKPQVPTFSSRTELVLVPVMVRNHGQPVAGLKQAQFTVEEDGKPRDIATFEEVTTSAAPIPAPKSTAVEFSNYVAAPQAARRMTVILLDLLYTPWAEQQRTRNYVLKYLSTHVSADEPTALLVLSRRGLRQVHSFTTRTQVLLDAVRGVQAETQPLAEDPQVAAEIGALQSSMGLGGAAGFQEIRQQFMIEDIMNVFAALSQSYAGIPGRKSLIWVSGGFPFPNPMSGPGHRAIENMQTAWKMLNGANIAVYPVDVHGLLASAMPIPFLGAAFHDTFRAFADATGGRACLNNNDIAQCIERSTRDSESYYLLGFYVPAADRKSGWHKLKVKLAAKHSEMRYREGYLLGEPIFDYKHGLLNGYYYSPLDYTAVAMSVAITGMEPVNNGRKVKFAISVPPSALSVDRDQNNLMELQYSVVVFDARNISVGDQSQTVRGNLKPENLATIMQAGLTHNWDLDIAPGKYQFKWIVTDNLSGRWGSVTAQVEVN